MSNNSSYSPLMPGEEGQSNKGGLIIVVAIIVLMLIGGLFVINSKKSPEGVMTTDTVVSAEIMSTSTSLDDIDRDINNVETSVMDNGLNQLDQEASNL